MENSLPALPPGATLDQTSSMPPLPPGATLDSGPPKLPDTSGLQATVQKNLTPEVSEDGSSKEQTPQTDAQRLDTGLGFSASGALRSGSDGKNIQQPLPPAVRGGLVDAYKNGAATDAGDYMQNALPAAANAASSAPEPDYSTVLKEAFYRGWEKNIEDFKQTSQLAKGQIPENAPATDKMDQYLTAPYKMGLPDFKRILAKTFYGITESSPEFAGAVAGGVAGTAAAGGPESPASLVTGPLGTLVGAAGSHYIKELAPAYAEELKANNGDQEKAWQAAKIKTGIGAAGTGVSFALFGFQPFENAVKDTLFQAFAAQPAAGMGQQVAMNAAEGKPLTQDVAQAGVEAAANTAIPLTAHIITKATMNTVAGHEALKPTVGDAIGKDAKDVTPQDIDNTIGKSFENTAPKAQDFHDVATVIDHTNNTANSFLPERALSGVLTQPDQDFETGKSAVITAYHGTPRDFDSFQSSDVNKENHHFFTNDIASAETYAKEPFMGEEGIGNPNIRNAQIKMDNPKVIDAEGKTWAQIGDKGTSSNYEAHLAQAEGHDGLIIKNVRDAVADNDNAKPSNVYVTFDNKNISNLSKSTLDTLHQVYKETGVHPDQVFEDAKTHPEIAQQLAEGKVPDAYAHLREDVQTAADETQTVEGGGNGKEPPSAYNPEHPFEEGAPQQPTRSQEGASTSINPLAKIFNPAGISESAKDMATAIRQGRGPATQTTAVIQDGLEKFSKTFSGMSDKDRLGFIHYMETRSEGRELPEGLEDLQPAADKIKDIYAQMGEELQKSFPDVGLRKDYFTHQFENKDAADKFFSDWVAKQGSERNLKARAFPTLAEAMEAGLKPKTTNPIETVMSYVTNMNNLIAAHRTVELAKEAGIADFYRKGEQPDGWVPLNGNLAEEGGKVLYAPEDAARVYNNDISEKVSGPIGDILDMYQRANNFVSKLVLGLSGFHYELVTLSSMATDVARGTLEDTGRAVTPLANTLRGEKYINAYLGRDQLPPELQKAMDLAIRNNIINVKQQDYWKAGPAKDYWDIYKTGSFVQEAKQALNDILTANPKEDLVKAAGDLKEGKIVDAALRTLLTAKHNPAGETVATLANEVGRIMDTINKPLFDYYVPRLKTAGLIDDTHAWLQDHPNASPKEQDRAVQDIGKKIDNSFGEMMRDNLFFHQITRQTLQLAFLSYSWVVGAARMLKGVPDTAQFALGKVGMMDGKELTPTARYLLGMAATYAVVNGMRTYMGTGQAPDDWKDFVYPRTGGVTAQGKEEREIIPSHIGQFTNYLHEGIGELGNELSPGLKLIYHLTTNQDFRGLPITNENNSWFTKERWGEYAQYVLGDLEPMGIKNFLQGKKKGSEISLPEQLLGSRQAPRFITDPEGYNATMKRVNDNKYQQKLKSDRKMQEQYEK